MASNLCLKLRILPQLATVSSRNNSLLLKHNKCWYTEYGCQVGAKPTVFAGNKSESMPIASYYSTIYKRPSKPYGGTYLSAINSSNPKSSFVLRGLTSKPKEDEHNEICKASQPSNEPELALKQIASVETEETLEEHETTIYKGILSTQIKLVKSFSLLTSAIGLSCQPMFLYQIQGNSGSLAVAVASGAFLSFFTFATPLLIHWVSKKYVTELLYNKIDDTYTAVTYSLLLRKKKINFKVNDVKIPDIPSMFTTFIVGGGKEIPLFVDGVQAFSAPQHYVKLMGYDKPLDLRWDKEADASRSVVEARRRRTDKQKDRRRSSGTANKQR